MTINDFKLRAVGPGDVASSPPLVTLFQNAHMRHLAREYPQNTADATLLMRLAATAAMNFRFGTVERSALAPYGFETAVRHAASCEEPSIRAGDIGDRVRFFAIEDSAGGLDGEVTPKSNDITSPLGKYLFAVGTGISGKGGKSNGRYGVGSLTGALASKIRLMYVYSRRRCGTSYGSARFSVPRHELDGEVYSTEARLAVFDDQGEYLGILKGEEADAMASVFGFDTSPDYTGLSVAVIEPVDGVNFDTAVEAVLIEQFYQISKGIVSIKVEDRDAGRAIVIDASNIRSFFQTDEFAELRARLRRRGRPFAFDPLDRTVQALDFLSRIDGLEVHQIDVFDADSLPDGLRNDYLSGKPVAVSVAGTAARADGSLVSGRIVHYLMKTAEGQHGQLVLVRDAIVNVKKAVGFVAMSVSRDDDIACLLGDCEDTQHANYIEKNADDRGWADCSDAISLFVDGVSVLRRHLADASAKSDRTSLAHIFPMPGRNRQAVEDGGAEGDGTTGEVVVPDLSKADVLEFRESRKHGTVTGTLTAAARKKVSQGETLNLLVTVDYAASKKGNGSFADGAGSVQVIDPEATVSQSGNGSRVEAYGLSEDFSIVIRDVDFKRDLDLSQRIINDMEIEEAA